MAELAWILLLPYDMMVQFRHWTPTAAFAGSAAPALRIVPSGSPELDDVREEDDLPALQETPTPAPAPTAVATSADPGLDAELIAMRAVGEALAKLDDAEARARVVRWAMDRFCPDARSAATPEPVAAPVQQPIPMYTQPVAPIVPITVFSCPMAANSAQPAMSAPAAVSTGPGSAASDSHASSGPEPPAGTGHILRWDNEDPQLSVSDLETFFDKPHPVEDEPRPLEDAVEPEHIEEPAPPAVAMDLTAAALPRPTVSKPIHLMLQDLITQFRDLANEWEFAVADP